MANVKTRQITVTSGAWVPISASLYARSISIGEDPSVANWPTTAFSVAAPTSSDNPHTVAIGGTFLFQPPSPGSFLPGEVIGYVQTATGSTTFFIAEQ